MYIECFILSSDRISLYNVIAKYGCFRKKLSSKHKKFVELFEKLQTLNPRIQTFVKMRRRTDILIKKKKYINIFLI